MNEQPTAMPQQRLQPQQQMRPQGQAPAGQMPPQGQAPQAQAPAARQMPPQAQPSQPQQPQGARPMAPAATPKDRSHALVVAALVCGIVSIVGSPTAVAGLIAGIAAILIAVTLWKSVRNNMLTAGLICGIVGTTASLVLLVSGWSLWEKFVFVPRTDRSTSSQQVVSSVTEPVSSRLPATFGSGYVVDFQITKIEVDEGDIIVYYTLHNNSSTSSVSTYQRYDSPSDTPWLVNGIPVKVSAFSSYPVNAGDSTDSWFYFSHEDIEGFTSPDQIYSIHGQIEVESYVNSNLASTFTFAVDL
jgi:hypothetical protein